MTHQLLVAKLVVACYLTVHWSSFYETGFYMMLTRNSSLMPNSRPASNIWEPPKGALLVHFCAMS